MTDIKQEIEEFPLPVNIQFRRNEFEQYDDSLVDVIDSQSKVQQRLYIDSDYIVNVRTNDFYNDELKIHLKLDDSMVILFYSNNQLSKSYLNAFLRLQQDVPTVTYGVVNCLTEKNVAEAFKNLNNDIDHPFHWARLRSYPFILVYRKGWPQAFYKGKPFYNELKDFCMNKVAGRDYKNTDEPLSPIEEQELLYEEEQTYKKEKVEEEPEIIFTPGSIMNSNAVEIYDP